LALHPEFNKTFCYGVTETIMAKEYEEHEEHSGGGYFRGLVTGVLVGAAAALLMAPKRGEEMRQELAEGAGRFREKADELKGRAEGLSTRVSETAQELKERGQHLMDSAVERGTAVVEHAQQEAGEFKAEAKEEMRGAKDTVAAAKDEASTEAAKPNSSHNGGPVHDVVKSV
jgi:gas vesicle protein